MESNQTRIVYKVVLTGGPCAGKTTGQARLATFFENLGWTVYQVPEAATILLSGGVKFAEVEDKEVFQQNILKVIMAIEDTFFNLADSCKTNCLVICDRGAMDPSAYTQPFDWKRILLNNKLNEIEIRDNRYNLVLHLVTAAKGAEEFYTLEGLSLARALDEAVAQAWVGHPYLDVIDNSTGFETKMRRMINAVCHRMSLNIGDRLAKNVRKLKFLVSVKDDVPFTSYRDFEVVHHYLLSGGTQQSRLRKRGTCEHWNYTYTVRRPELHGQIVETRMLITAHEYAVLLSHKSPRHYPIHKKRRCFLWNSLYFQLDFYEKPNHSLLKNLCILETFTTLEPEEIIKNFPPFLEIKENVTANPKYSMYNLSFRDVQPDISNDLIL